MLGKIPHLLLWKNRTGVFNIQSTILEKINTTLPEKFNFSFFPAMTKFSFCEEDWALDYNSMKI